LANLYHQNKLLDQHFQRLPEGSGYDAGRNDVKAGKISPIVEGLWKHSARLSYHCIADKPRWLLYGGH